MNRTVKLLMLSDIFLITGFGLMGPILAIFIKEGITGGSIFAVGLASTIHIIVKSAVQLPFSRYVDSHKDKLRWLILGTFAMCSVPFIYMSATSIYHIFIAQIILGISGGLAFPTWLGLWSTNLDKKHESFEWSLYSTLTGLGTAATASIGAAIAQFFNFRVTFIFTGILALIGATILFSLERKNVKVDGASQLSYHKKRKLVQNNRHGY